MKDRDFMSAKAKEALLPNKEEEKCCGNCCWFYAEDTDGWGFCACQKNRVIDMEHCSDMCEDDFVSREEMRHHMAVLLQADRWYRATHDEENGALRYMPDPIDYRVALAFAYQYMKVFSKL